MKLRGGRARHGVSPLTPALSLKGKGRSVLLALTLLATPALATPALAKDDLILGMTSFPSMMHPYINPEAVKGYTLGMALRPVTALDPSWTLGCMSCTEVPTVENGGARLETLPDGSQGLAATIHLKPDLKWGDGVPVTTADLAFTAKVAGDPLNGFTNNQTWLGIKRVDVVDATTAVLHFSPVSVLYKQIPVLLPEHIERPIFERAGNPAEYIKATAYNRAPTTPGLYNGPFIVTGFQTGAQIVLEPNPHWAGKPPGFKRIVIRNIGNTAALQANLLSGDVDMAPGEGFGLTLDQVLALRKQQPDRFVYVFRDSTTYLHLDVQLDNPILADVRVRRALLMSLDRQLMSDKLVDGLWHPADAWIAPQDPVATKGLPHVGYDPAGARALFKEAGWTPGDDGVLRNAAGERFALELRGSTGIHLNELFEAVAQQELKAVGVALSIKNEEPRALFGETLKHRTYPGLAFYSWLFLPSYPARQILGIDQIPTEANNWGGSNYMDWKNPAVEAALKVTETELDPAKAQVAWDTMQRAYATELPVLPLFFRPESHVLPKWLRGYVPTGHTNYTTLHVEDWHAE